MKSNSAMKQITLILLLLCFCFSALTAQEPVSSLLWEIKGKDINQPSYLFGTFHLLCKEDFSISPVMETKIKACRQFYGELKMDDPSLQALLMQLIALKGTTLEQLLPREDYTRISESFQRITGMPILLFNNAKPFLCLSMLAQKAIDCKDQVQPETIFTQLAQQLHIPVKGLETVTEQMEAIDSEPLDSQVVSLKKMILNFDSVRQVTEEMVAVYKKRNTDSLYAFMQGNGMDDRFELALLRRRNEKWVPKIEAAAKEAPAFFAVGAGHLGGPDGVINLLRKKGYTLSPVRY